MPAQGGDVGIVNIVAGAPPIIQRAIADAGVWLFWAAAPSGSAYTNVLIQASQSQTGPFVQIANLVYVPTAPVSQYYDEQGNAWTWYKVAYYDSVDQIQTPFTSAFLPQSMLTTYTTTDKVAQFMQLRNSQGNIGFDSINNPSIDMVTQLIQRAEDRIDYETGHAWRTRYSQSPSGTDTASARYEIYDQGDISYVAAGLRVKLTHRSIIDFDSTQGDAFQCFNGDSWVDFLVLPGANNRAGDWWIDNADGVLWIINFAGANFIDSVRVKYRYGETSVPGDIQEAATKIVACSLAEADDRSFMIPSGGNGIVLDAKVQLWERDWHQIVFEHSETKSGG